MTWDRTSSNVRETTRQEGEGGRPRSRSQHDRKRCPGNHFFPWKPFLHACEGSNSAETSRPQPTGGEANGGGARPDSRAALDDRGQTTSHKSSGPAIHSSVLDRIVQTRAGRARTAWKRSEGPDSRLTSAGPALPHTSIMLVRAAGCLVPDRTMKVEPGPGPKRKEQA